MPVKFIFLAAFLLLFLVVPSAVDLLTEWYWFDEVAFTSIFIRTLTAKAILGGVVALAAFGTLALNFRLPLRRITTPYLLFPGGGDIQPLALEPRQLRLLGTGVAAVAALFLGLFASTEWLTWLQFQHAVPFGPDGPALRPRYRLLHLHASVPGPRPLSGAGAGGAVAGRIDRGVRHVRDTLAEPGSRHRRR